MKNIDQRTTAQGNELRSRPYDLAVIGAGPAGSLTASLAAAAGLKTALIEKERMPRDKICGGLISSRSLSLLPKEMNVPRAIAFPVYDLTVVRGKKHYHYHADEMLGLLTDRRDFDLFLYQCALHREVEPFEKYRVSTITGVYPGDDKKQLFTIGTDSKVHPALQTRYLVGADGAYSRVARLTGLRKGHHRPCGHGISTQLTSSETTESTRIEFYPLPLLGGMGWSFYRPGRINRGVGGLASTHNLIAAYRSLFSPAPGEKKVRGGLLPFCGPLLPVGAGNLLLVGDAAGLVDPFSGEGLFNTFISARMAVSAMIAAENSTQTAAAIYNHLVADYFRKGFLPTLIGAVLLHGRSVLRPSSLPIKMAALAENRLFFNRHPSLPENKVFTN
ncbi:MAG: NAD(P)/FAD-dependent oxidoreductase [Bacillota bacterium]